MLLGNCELSNKQSVLKLREHFYPWNVNHWNFERTERAMFMHLSVFLAFGRKYSVRPLLAILGECVLSKKVYFMTVMLLRFSW